MTQGTHTNDFSEQKKRVLKIVNEKTFDDSYVNFRSAV